MYDHELKQDTYKTITLFTGLRPDGRPPVSPDCPSLSNSVTVFMTMPQRISDKKKLEQKCPLNRVCSVTVLACAATHKTMLLAITYRLLTC